ncbi:Pyrimidine-specific ribonucleoside hydrolase RihB [Arthrobacter sp. Bi83]|uniref:nucleoside hydrolase n=1 Tax=Arthrobacter sp. Bi83 TaxID=2822353 RepID=UPI001DDF1F9C|nr:nucleoside hydrolase [Arthrobacter sp. Bi83]CAH0125336.1 Pyrimidine-specific ribonucleoside hydrolase RihB [Arthrobacter sp. Bi83]
MKRKVVLDVDTGTDDAIAVMMAGLAREIDLIGCTTVWGNHGTDETTENTLRVLDLLGRDDVPVRRGLDRPFAPIPFIFEDHVDSAREAIHPHEFPIPRTSERQAEPGAVEWLVETLRAATEPITLVPVAPLTNIAAAITLDPSIVDAVDEIVIMGGAHALGNVTPSAEANIWHDPVAADVVFRAGFERLVLVPLDATHRANVSLGQIARLRELGPVGAAAAELIAQRIRGYNETQPMDEVDTAPIHDALCIAYLLDPEVIDIAPYHVAVDTVSPLTFGKTVVDVAGRSGHKPNAYVALDADAQRFGSLLHGVIAASGPAR